jgi:hypothetical protein
MGSPSANGCVNTPINVGRSCPISGGSCWTATGTCNAAGYCQGTALAAGTQCDDGNSCTQGETCNGQGACGGGRVTTGTACDDGNACTYGETCSSTGVCGGGAGVTCKSSPCTQRVCNGTPSCTVTNLAAGSSCDDANACTYADACDGKGGCAGTAVKCLSLLEGCFTASCNGTSTCTETAKADGTACGIHAAGTPTSTCSSGTCSACTVTIMNDPALPQYACTITADGSSEGFPPGGGVAPVPHGRVTLTIGPPAGSATPLNGSAVIYLLPAALTAGKYTLAGPAGPGVGMNYQSNFSRGNQLWGGQGQSGTGNGINVVALELTSVSPNGMKTAGTFPGGPVYTVHGTLGLTVPWFGVNATGPLVLQVKF